MGYKYVFLAWVLLQFALPALSAAHPVTYAGGGLIDTMVGHHHSQIDFTYSPTAALGLTAAYMKFRDAHHDTTEAWIPRINALLTRWNLPAAQANLYAWSGFGSTGDEQAAGHLGGQFDGETRYLYGAAKVDSFLLDDAKDLHFGVLRVGVAPYPVEFGQINVFFILQSDYGSSSEDRWELAPFIRMFFKDYLVELGSTIDGDVMVNGMIHFYLG